MSDRTNLTIDSDVHDRLAQAKGSTDTWDEFLSRLINASVSEQSHINRSTLEDFDDEDETELLVQPSEEGQLQIEFLDSDGQTLGETTLAALGPEQEITLEVREGVRVNG